MIVTYKLDLNDEDDIYTYQAINIAKQMRSVIWDFIHNTKHRLEALPDGHAEGYEKALEDFHNLMDQEGITAE